MLGIILIHQNVLNWCKNTRYCLTKHLDARPTRTNQNRYIRMH